MSGNESLFTEIKKKKYENVTFGDNRAGQMIQISKINKDPSKSLENVYLVKGLEFNRLSISQPCDIVNNVIFHYSHCIVQNLHDDKSILIASYPINYHALKPLLMVLAYGIVD